MIYDVIISDDAYNDMSELSDVIFNQYKAPITAAKYMRELRTVIRGLGSNAHIYEIQTRKSLQKYGINVRRINYKRMTIIYTIHQNIVFIHRIIPQSMISGL